MTAFCPWQTVVVPAIVPATAGSGFTVIDSVEVVPFPQALFPFTVMFPEVDEVPKFTIMVSLVLEPLALVGKVQIYEVELEIAGTV